MSEELISKTIKPATDFIGKIKKDSRVTIVYGHDNDTICSAAIIYKLIEKKFGIKSKLVVSEFNFKLGESSFDEIKKSNPEFVIVLDIAEIPKITEVFLENYETIVIDHHGPSIYKKLAYSNPMLHDKKSYIPVTYISYRIYKTFFDPKEILWIAGIGTLADHGVRQTTDLFKEIKKYNYELVDDIEFVDEKMFDSTTLGLLSKMFDSAAVVKNIEGVRLAEKILIESGSYKDILQLKNADIKKLSSLYETKRKEFERLVDDFHKNKKEIGMFLIYEIKSKLKLKSNLAGYIQQFYKDKIIVVYQLQKDFYEMSFRRGPDVKTDLRTVAKFSVRSIENSSAGGHEPASAARIPKKDLDKFVENLKLYSE